MARSLLTLLIVTVLAATAFADPPAVSRTEPMSLPPGQPVDVTFLGGKLAGATGVWCSVPAHVELSPAHEGNGTQADRVTFRITLDSKAPRGPVGMRVVTPGGVSNLRLLAVSDRIGTIDAKAGRLDMAMIVPLPAIVDGQIDGENARYFKFTAGTGQKVSFEVWARRLGSPLDAVLRVLDASGREVAYLDDTDVTGADPRGSVTLATAGDYFAELYDVRYRGGADYAYQLRISDGDLPPLYYPSTASTAGASIPQATEQEPNNAIETPNVIALPTGISGRFEALGDRDFYQFEGHQGQRWKFAGQTRELGSAADLLMRLYKPDGGMLAEAEDAGTDEGVLDANLPADGTYKLCIEELNQRAGADYAYCVQVQPYAPGFALQIELDKYDIAPGATLKAKVNVRRRDFNGPIALRVEGMEGLAVADNVLGEGANEIQLAITPAVDLTPGSINAVTIVGTAKIGEVEVRVAASTRDALRKTCQGLPYPPAALDGIVAVGLVSPNAEAKK